MKIHHLFISGCAALLFATTAQAGSITCGDYIISDDEDVGQSMEQVRDKCGPPTSMEGDNWIYDRSAQGQGIYIVHFDGSGRVDSIQQQLDGG
jgi:hypothetical protein